jgi:hypothetical protein
MFHVERVYLILRKRAMFSSQSKAQNAEVFETRGRTERNTNWDRRVTMGACSRIRQAQSIMSRGMLLWVATHRALYWAFWHNERGAFTQFMFSIFCDCWRYQTSDNGVTSPVAVAGL